MNNPMIISLINNAALLLILSIIYGVSYYIHEKSKKIRPYVKGVLITAICLAIMMVPWENPKPSMRYRLIRGLNLLQKSRAYLLMMY